MTLAMLAACAFALWALVVLLLVVALVATWW